VYNSEVDLEGDEPDLRTGMSCKVEIIVAQYEDAVYIPVQAVVRIAGQPTAYVVNDGVIEERPVEIGLDNNRMVRIVSGIEEGETVLLTPPLKAATIEDGDQMLEGQMSEGGGGNALKQRINQKLEEANGTQGPGAGAPAGDGAGAEQGQPQGLPSMEQMRQMQQRLANMSPEERQQEMEKLRKQFENMSEEDRERLRQRFQSGGQGQGPGGGPRQGGPRQGGPRQGGPRQGRGAGQGATQRPQGAERNP
jgi:hypothetical protein